jgi:putative glycosyltransferase
MTDPQNVYLSVVTSLYHSGPYLEEFCRRMADAAKKITDDYEIVLVNDGSPDDALERAIAVQRGNTHVVVIDLSRNFGQHKAMMTGMNHAKGKYVFLIEVDLEECPEWVGDFHEKLEADQGADVVFGVQVKRKGGFGERLMGALFYKTFNFLAQIKIPENHVTARLMSRRYVNALLAHRDRALFLGGLYEQVGFRQIPYWVTKVSHSQTTYTLRRKLQLVINSIVSFSTAPLSVIFWCGLGVFFLSATIFIWVLYQWWVKSISPGWTSIIASIWAVGGILMLSLGVIGLYLKKALEEVTERPYTVIKQIHRKP